MADRINFSKKINDSVQVGDELYWAIVSGTTIGTTTSVGIVTGIGEKHIEVGGEINGVVQIANTPSFSGQEFFMFQKPVEENVSSLKGYYAEVTFANSSTTKQELFAVGSEITISSK